MVEGAGQGAGNGEMHVLGGLCDVGWRSLTICSSLSPLFPLCGIAVARHVASSVPLPPTSISHPLASLPPFSLFSPLSSTALSPSLVTGGFPRSSKLLISSV